MKEKPVLRLKEEFRYEWGPYALIRIGHHEIGMSNVYKSLAKPLGRICLHRKDFVLNYKNY